MRDLRNSPKAHLFDGSDGIAELIWQGDLGSGISTGSGVFGEAGCNPCVLSPALPSGGTSNMKAEDGIPVRMFKLGDIVRGDYGTEFMYCRLVLGSTTDLLPGQAFQIDENFSATLTTTSGLVLSQPGGFGMVFAPATAAGTYFLWLAIRGNIGMRAAASSILGGEGETTATAGVLKFLVSHTGSSLTIKNAVAFAASSNITFTGTTVSGSPTISAVASQISLEGATGGITDLQLGATITGSNLPSNACIGAIRKVGTAWAIDIGTSTTGAQKTLQNATGSAAGTTFTVTTNVQGFAANPFGAAATN